ncbi:3D domain-containing protein [Paenibacillus sp. CAU 1782]
MKKQLISCAAIALTAALVAGTAQASAQTHTIKTNDTFWKLAQYYQVPLADVLGANAALDPLNLQPGMQVKIPVQEAISAKAVPNQQAAIIAADTQKSEAVKSEPAKADTTKTEAPKAEAPKAEAKTVMAPDGSTHVYAKQLQLKATAYTAAASENGKWGAVDYFGNKLKVGTVAVDPAMIPLGSKLYVTGYQYPGLPEGGMLATATDMGGAIKDNRIDIFVPGTTQQALKFGFQNVNVYVLK